MKTKRNKYSSAFELLFQCIKAKNLSLSQWINLNSKLILQYCIVFNIIVLKVRKKGLLGLLCFYMSA